MITQTSAWKHMYTGQQYILRNNVNKAWKDGDFFGIKKYKDKFLKLFYTFLNTAD